MLPYEWILFIIILALCVDMLMGDPRWLPHPVVMMGRYISGFEARFNKGTDLNRQWKGLLLLCSLLGAVFILTWGILFFAYMLHPIVGRDTEDLDEQEIVRGTVETVAENTVDGVTAPLFWRRTTGTCLPHDKHVRFNGRL
jgi:adenosylcobinamide-phosphate synthase